MSERQEAAVDATVEAMKVETEKAVQTSTKTSSNSIHGKAEEEQPEGTSNLNDKQVDNQEASNDNDDDHEAAKNTGVAMTIDDATSKADSDNNTGGAPAWDHSSRPVVVNNILKFEDTKKVTKAINKWLEKMKEKHPDATIEVEKVRKPPKDKWAVVTFKTEEMCKPFLDFINDSEGVVNKRGGKITARMADENNNKDNKRKAELDDRFVPSKRQRRQDAPQARRPVTEDEIKDKITPLWRLSKEEQLETKMKNMIRKCALKIVQEIKARFRTLQKEKARKEKVGFYSWLEGSRSIEVKDMVSAPTPLRNKSEFTFGYRYLFDENEEESAPDEQSSDNNNTKESPKVPAVGFMVTGWAGGVSRPHGCQNIPPEVCSLVDVVDQFLSTSPLPPYDALAHTGFWRTMTVRSSRRTKECMVIIVHAPVSGGVGDQEKSLDYSDRFEKEKSRLVSVLTSAELPIPDDESPLKVTSIFFQSFEGLSNPPPEHPVQHVYGKEFLHEKLGQCTFQISPGAFFQVNTEGAEILYQIAVDKVREVAKDPKNTLLFDVCCGTGTIGLTCLKEGAVGKVVGVDISEPAIVDAQKNAELNGFTTTEEESAKQMTRFVASRAEYVLHKEIRKAKENRDMKFVAVVDPARDGLHADVVRALRANERINRIVYVSCNPTGSLIPDAAMLCQPPSKKYQGRPFQVSSAFPVDMFPLTDHCELVMVFDRLSPEEMS